MINKIAGKRSPTEVKHLQIGDKEITTVSDIADTRGIVFRDLFQQTLFIKISVTQSPCRTSNSKMQLTQYGNLQHSFLFRRTTGCTFEF